MSDWQSPTLSDPYSNFLESLKARDLDAITMGGATAIPVPTIGMMRYDRPNNVFQEYTSSGWQTKILSVAGGGTGSSTPAGAIGALGLGTMAVQNANAVNIVGGSISGLGGLSSNGPVSFGGTLSVSGAAGFGTSIIDYGTLQVNGITTLNGQVNMNNMNAAAITAASLGLSGNLTCARLDATQLILTYTDLYARGVLRAGPGDIPITNGADGTLLAGRIGYGYTGSGTRVLLDNNTWGVLNVSSFITSIVNDMSFGSGEDFKDLNISGLGLASIDELMFIFHGPTTILDLGGYQWSVAPMKPFNTSVIRIQKYPLGGTNAAALGPSTHSFAAYRIRLG